MAEETLLETRNLRREFGALVAVDDVVLQVKPRTLHSIIGPNGAGKTTLLNCVSGVFHLTSGDILFQGKSLVGLKPHQIAALGIGRTFQNIRLFGESITADLNIH